MQIKYAKSNLFLFQYQNNVILLYEHDIYNYNVMQKAKHRQINKSL